MGSTHDRFVNLIFGMTVGALLGFIGVAWATLNSSEVDGVVALFSAACYGIPLGALGGGIGIVLILKFYQSGKGFNGLKSEFEEVDMEKIQMKPCPECKSDKVYQYKKDVDTTTIGGELLPKLASNLFSSAKIRPVVCFECGYVRFFAAKEALARLENSEHWMQV